MKEIPQKMLVFFTFIVTMVAIVARAINNITGRVKKKGKIVRFLSWVFKINGLTLIFTTVCTLGGRILLMWLRILPYINNENAVSLVIKYVLVMYAVSAIHYMIRKTRTKVLTKNDKTDLELNFYAATEVISKSPIGILYSINFHAMETRLNEDMLSIAMQLEDVTSTQSDFISQEVNKKELVKKHILSFYGFVSINVLSLELGMAIGLLYCIIMILVKNIVFIIAILSLLLLVNKVLKKSNVENK